MKNFFIPVFVFLFFLSGCHSNVALSERMIIQGIGVDKNENEYSVSIHVATVAEEKIKVRLFTGKGESIVEAVDNVVKMVGTKPFYSHNLYIVLGNGCAEDGIINELDFFVRYYETRPTVNIFFTEKNAYDIFCVKNDSGNYELMYNDEKIFSTERITGKVVNVSVIDCVNGLIGDGSSAYLPIIKEKENMREIDGTAVFKDGKLVRVFGDEGTIALNILKNRYQKGNITIENEEAGKIALSLRDVKCIKSVYIRDNVPCFNIDVTLNADISEVSKGIGKKLTSEFYKVFEEELNEELSGYIDTAINEALFEEKCDIFGFNYVLIQNEPDFWREYGEDWENIMVNAEFYVNVSSLIVRSEEEITPLL